MNSKIKKILRNTLSLLMAMLLLVSFGCDGTGNTDPTAEPTEAPTEEPTEEPGPTMEEILAALSTTEFTSAKNVILFIGDGMGQNHVPATDAITGGRYDGKLSFEYMTATNIVETVCAEGEPDSASGGTALACGYKSNRKYVGLDYKGNEIQNVTELAHSLGKSTGVITSESIVDATPATFSIHTNNRNDEEQVAYLQVTASVADLIIGGGKAAYESLMANTEDYPDAASKLTENNITWAKTWNEVEAYSGEGRLIATLTDDFWEEIKTMTPSLAEITDYAIQQLSKNENGFFLMVEGGAQDEIAHMSDVMELTRHMIAFDEAVEVGIKYAYLNKDTVVIVTADHNTGRLLPKEEADAYIEKNKKTDNYIGNDEWCMTNASLHCVLEAEKIAQAKNPDVDYDSLPYRFTTIAHTNDKVNVWAIGYGTEELGTAEKLKSFQIGKFIGKALSGEEFGSTDKNGKK